MKKQSKNIDERMEERMEERLDAIREARHIIQRINEQIKHDTIHITSLNERINGLNLTHFELLHSIDSTRKTIRFERGNFVKHSFNYLLSSDDLESQKSGKKLAESCHIYRVSKKRKKDLLELYADNQYQAGELDIARCKRQKEIMKLKLIRWILTIYSNYQEKIVSKYIGKSMIDYLLNNTEPTFSMPKELIKK